MAKTLEPIPAANERSPNRKPRYRSAFKVWLTKAEQDRFLRVYVESGFAMACQAVRHVHSWVYNQAAAHPDFLARFHEAKKLRQELQNHQIEGMTSKALNVIDATLAEREADPKLAFEAAQTHLKGVGVYKAKHEVTGEGGGPVLIREVEVRLSGNSNGG